MTTRYKKVPAFVNDDRFAPHVEIEFQELHDQKQRKGEATTAASLTMLNMNHKVLENVWISTTTTRIPHGLGAVPTEYNVYVKYDSGLDGGGLVTGSILTKRFTNLYWTNGGNPHILNHNLGVIPDVINIIPEPNTFSTNITLPQPPNQGCWLDYWPNVTINTAQFIVSVGIGAWRGTVNFIAGGPGTASVTPTGQWFEASRPDAKNLYLRATQNMRVTIVVKE